MCHREKKYGDLRRGVVSYRLDDLSLKQKLI